MTKGLQHKAKRK